jgi:hypothetical protein
MGKRNPVTLLQMVGSDTLVRAWLEGDWTVIEGAAERDARNLFRAQVCDEWIEVLPLLTCSSHTSAVSAKWPLTLLQDPLCYTLRTSSW